MRYLFAVLIAAALSVISAAILIEAGVEFMSGGFVAIWLFLGITIPFLARSLVGLCETENSEWDGLW